MRPRRLAATLLMVITGVLVWHLISAQAVSYYYDYQNRLVEINYDDNTWMEYTYDDNGNLIAKTYHNNNAFTITATAGDGGSISPASASVVSGGSQTFNIAPGAGHYIAEVDIDGVASASPVNSYTFSNVQREHSIHAKFAPYTYIITASVNGNGGTISPMSPNVPYGGSQTFTMTPSAGYCAGDVVVDGASVGNPASYSFSDVTGTHSITASFQVCSYSLTTSVTGSGNISPSSATMTYGGGQAFTITPGTGSCILDVQVDGLSRGPTSTYTFVNVTANHTLSANFGPAPAPVKNARTTQLYETLHDAYTGASDGDPLRSRNIRLTENFTANQPVSVTIDGGYNSGFSAHQGTTILQGAMVIGSGTVTLGNYLIGTTLHITASAGANGSISPSGTVAVNAGAGQAFAITADQDYHVTNILVDGIDKGAVTSYVFSDVTADHSISANFSTMYSITASPGANGSISPAGIASVKAGENETYFISPDVGYAVDDVLVDGTSRGPITTFTFDNVAANHTISASFVATYILTATAGAGGTISPPGPMIVNPGDSQTFNITPDAGFAISNVIVDGLSVGAVPSYTFSNVAADHTISASFIAVYTITATAGAGGSITPSGTVTLARGTNQTFSITPNSGFAIFSIVVDGANMGAVPSYTFNNVAANHTISASFIAVYTITATAGAGGSIAPSGSVAVNSGTNQTFNISPNAGFAISSVVVDGSNVGAVPSYTFSDVGDNHTISAGFFTTNSPIVNTSSGVGYTSLQSAYNDAADGDTILSKDIRITENFTANRNKSVTMDGGYNADFSSNSNKTTIIGATDINNGTVTLKNYLVSY